MVVLNFEKSKMSPLRLMWMIHHLEQIKATEISYFFEEIVTSLSQKYTHFYGVEDWEKLVYHVPRDIRDKTKGGHVTWQE